ncbi:hypothetical protein [Methanogenium organophilum]|uniref:Uncharacterized protein n=1 Tax=Methanogenium organophilum TaxID=2199 RepID=A0A9X9S3Q6_METOG|nr:hypothetical protein [Methanogenium organophilum]WAI01233.1 hypothetical protein OU421_12600 [Methanogenium organophilum]
MVDENSNYLYIEDWKVTKDRIRHFDDIILKIRLEGIPIALALFSIGYYLIPILQINEVPVFGNAACIPFFAVSFYIIGLMGMDFVHFVLLLGSVDHSKWIENLPQFKGKLQITTKLTNIKLTWFHLIYAMIFYASILGVSVFVGFHYLLM